MNFNIPYVILLCMSLHENGLLVKIHTNAYITKMCERNNAHVNEILIISIVVRAKEPKTLVLSPPL